MMQETFSSPFQRGQLRPFTNSDVSSHFSVGFDLGEASTPGKADQIWLDSMKMPFIGHQGEGMSPGMASCKHTADYLEKSHSKGAFPLLKDYTC